jgi:hypothetical protein
MVAGQEVVRIWCGGPDGGCGDATGPGEKGPQELSIHRPWGLLLKTLTPRRKPVRGVGYTLRIPVVHHTGSHSHV